MFIAALFTTEKARYDSDDLQLMNGIKNRGAGI
jgi:hypothetical protein